MALLCKAARLAGELELLAWVVLHLAAPGSSLIYFPLLIHAPAAKLLSMLFAREMPWGCVSLLQWCLWTALLYLVFLAVRRSRSRGAMPPEES